MKVHTELPWSLGDSGRSIIREVPGLADGYDHFMIAVVSAHSLVPVQESKANAQLIVTAVNTYPAVTGLVEALEKCAAVCAGETLHKNGLVEALESARSALSHYRELAGTSNEVAK